MRSDTKMAKLTITVNSVDKTRRDFENITARLRDMERVGRNSTRDISTSFRDMRHNTSNSVNGMKEIVTGAFREIGRLGVQAFLDIAIAVGNTATQIAQDIVAAGSDFTEGMSGIEALLQPTTAELEQLEIAARAMGDTTSFTSTQAANAIEMLGKNGLTAGEILDGALSSSLSLAASTGTDLTNAADIMTDAMANFGIQSADTSNTVNTLAGVVVNSKFDMDDMRLALAQAGGVAGSAGVSFEDFSTTIAGIAPLFSSGSDAGTSFKTFLQRLVPDTTAAEEAMRELGLITEDGSNRFFDAAGNMRSMSEISGVLQTSLSGLTEEQRSQALRTIFGTDAMRSAIGVANMGTEGFNELSYSISQIDAESAAASRLDNLAGDTTKLNSAVEGLYLRIFDLIEGPLRSMKQSLTEGIRIVSAFVDSIVSSEDPLETIRIGFVSLVNYLAESFWIGLDNAKAAFFDFVASLINNTNTTTGQLIDTFGEWSLAAVAWIADAVPEMVTEMLDFVSAIIREIEQNEAQIEAGLQVWVDKFSQWVQDVWPHLKSALMQLFEAFGVFLVQNAPTIAGWIAKINQWIMTEGLFLLSQAVWQMVVDLASYFAQTWREAFAHGTYGGDFVSGIFTGISNNWNNLVGYFSNMSNSFIDFGANLVWGFIRGIEDTWQSVFYSIDRGIQDVQQRFQDAFQFGSPSKVSMQWGEWVGEGFSEGINKALGETSVPDMLLSPSGLGTVGGSEGNQYHLHLQTANRVEQENLEMNFNTLSAIGSI